MQQKTVAGSQTQEPWFSGQGLFADIPAELWNSWAWQLKNRIQTIADLEKHLSLSPEELEGCKLANDRLLFAITPHFFNLIDSENPNCPIRRQVVPRIEETYTHPLERLDPIGEEPNMVAPGLVHKYPDRVLFLVTSMCASYCRYCTRSRLVSNAQDYDFRPDFDAAIAYIKEHKEVRDVLLSGGDPLLLPDRVLDKLLARLREIPHVEFIRIGTRIPIFMPQRITEEFCQMIRKHGPIWMSLHVNHPKECTLEMKKACEALICSYAILGNQSVLLKGVNDDSETLKALSHRLLQMGVRPYYLHQCDLIAGSSHFRTPLEVGVEMIDALRGHTTGYAVPQFVIDCPGGGGKVVLQKNPVVGEEQGCAKLRNYKGDSYLYPL